MSTSVCVCVPRITLFLMMHSFLSFLQGPRRRPQVQLHLPQSGQQQRRRRAAARCGSPGGGRWWWWWCTGGQHLAAHRLRVDLLLAGRVAVGRLSAGFAVRAAVCAVVAARLVVGLPSPGHGHHQGPAQGHAPAPRVHPTPCPGQATHLALVCSRHHNTLSPHFTIGP